MSQVLVQYSGGLGGQTDTRGIDEESFARIGINHSDVLWNGDEPQEMTEEAALTLVDVLPLEFSIVGVKEAEPEEFDFQEAVNPDPEIAHQPEPILAGDAIDASVTSDSPKAGKKSSKGTSTP